MNFSRLLPNPKLDIVITKKSRLAKKAKINQIFGCKKLFNGLMLTRNNTISPAIIEIYFFKNKLRLFSIQKYNLF